MSNNESSNIVIRTLTHPLTHEAAENLYDHEITLIDTTDPNREPRPSRPNDKPTIDRRSTRRAVRDRMQNRRYAKYQESRYSYTGSSVNTGKDTDSEIQRTETQTTDPPPPAQRKPKLDPATETVDFAEQDGAEEPDIEAEIPPTTQLDRLASKFKKPKHKQQFEIDVLYENQRGSFFCGIPLYSHSSLLNFDPSPWVTEEFKASPVNITNAQVPDPSWMWAWKTWYVDMGNDVDEEGWQYSFAFGRSFAWHGTHPWFHSFVRRRRWLRKRVKQDAHIRSGKLGSLQAGHHLTGDYFTIHPKRDRSPGSNMDGNGQSTQQTSMINFDDRDAEDEIPPEDIKDIPSLMKALQLAKIDREKIDLVRRFLDQGGDELAYLGQYIPEITSLLIYQNSRRQLLAYLKETASSAQEHRNQHQNDKKPEGEEESRRIDNLLKAVDAANKQISGLEYWTDRKHVLRTADSDAQEIQALATAFDEPAPRPDSKDGPIDEIRGISEKAEVFSDPTMNIPHTKKEDEAGDEDGLSDREKEGKGKEKAQEQNNGAQKEDPPRLKADMVLIPDDGDNEVE